MNQLPRVRTTGTWTVDLRITSGSNLPTNMMEYGAVAV